MPVWQRNTEGPLTWVNEAYGDAVEAKTREEALREGRELLPTGRARENPRHRHLGRALSRQGVDRCRGERAFFDVFDVKSRTGSAGMAIDTSAQEALREELKRTLKSHAENPRSSRHTSRDLRQRTSACSSTIRPSSSSGNSISFSSSSDG